MRKIIYTRPDGGMSVVTPCINTVPQPEDITEAEAEQRAWDKLPVDAINPQFVDESTIPADRTFRNAWKAVASGVEHDMVKCREITREVLRIKRAPLLAALDVDYMRADEAGNTAEKVRIAAEKKRLRDITDDPAIDAAGTVDALKVILAN